MLADRSTLLGAVLHRPGVWVGLLLIVLGVAPVYAQTPTGQLRGRVNDAAGGPIPGATVQVLGTNLNTITNANGDYLFSSVPIGTYSVQASVAGVPGQTITGAWVQAGQTLTVNFFLGGAPQITVTRPAGGETWTAGSTESIRWMGRDVNSTIDILLFDPVTGQGTSIVAGTVDDGEFRWTIPNTVTPSFYNIQVRSSNNPQLIGFSSTFTIQGALQPPTVINPGTQQNDDGDVVSLQIQASDPNGGPLTYSASGLPTGLGIGATTGLINGTVDSNASSNSPYTVIVSVVDNQSLSDSTAFLWTVTNPPPVANGDSYTTRENTFLTVAAGQGVLVNDTDPDGDALTARVVSGTGNGTLNLAADGSFTYLPNIGFVGTDRFIYAADDGLAADTATVMISVLLDTDPVLTNPGNQSSSDGDGISLQLQATDPDGDPLVYGATNLPDGLSLNPSTGLISGTITSDASANSPYSVSASAVDGQGNLATARFQWTVTNPAPSVTNPGSRNSDEGEVVSLQVRATDPDGDPLVYSATNLPDGLSLNPSTGLISGTITNDASTNSPYTVILLVEDSQGRQSGINFVWGVTNPAPIVTDPGAQTSDEGDTVSLLVTVTDDDTLSYAASGLPPGLSINPATGLINGMVAADAATNSPYTVTFTVTDTQNAATSVSFSWTVRPPTNTQPTLTMVRPNGGEVWIQGATEDIQWTSRNVVGEVQIDLFRNGSLDRTLAANTANDGVHTWSIPTDLAEDDTYRMRISSIGTPGVSDESDADFSIQAALPVVTFQVDMNVELPNVQPGEVIGVRGSVAPLSWTATTPMFDEDGDEVFTADVLFAVPAGTEITYKFVHNTPDNSVVTWEGGVGPGGPDDRTFTFTGAEVLPLAFWENQQPALAVTPPTHVFGAVALGDAITREVMIENTGLGLLIGSVALSDSNQFTILSGGGSFRLAEGQQRQVQVQFAPTAPGSHEARLRVEHNDPQAAVPFEVALEGSGLSEMQIMVVEEAPPTQAQTLNLIVTSSEAFTPTQGDLFYRRGGERSFQRLDLSAAGAEFVGSVPPEYVTERGVDYYVRLADGDRTVTFPPVSPEENPTHSRVRVAQIAPGGDFQPDTYSMVTVPLDLDQPTAASVFGDDYGAADPSQWRFLRWNNGAQSYDDLGEGAGGALTPGRGFWLITRLGGEFDVETASSVDASQPYALSVPPGWSQIGNPFAFSVAWSAVVNSASVEAPVGYRGSQGGQDPYRYGQQTLAPWEGYWVYNPGPSAVQLTVPPVETGAGKGSASPRVVTESSYTVQLIAQVPGLGLQDAHNYLGFAEGASDGRDRLDVAEAPGIGPHVRLSILEQGEHLAGSYKTSHGGGQRWDLEVSVTAPEDRQPVREPVVVTLHEQGALPEGFDRYVLDLDYGSFLPLEGNTFSIVADEALRVRHLRVLIGTAVFAEAQREGIPLEVFDYTLSQNYPNPFNPETRIRFQVSRRERVVVAVYNALGQRIRTLVDDVRETGAHEIVWDGRNTAGHTVGSGVYFYRFTAGSFTASKKMLLMR